MNKPTIFFSHSSKDRDSLLVLKELLEKKTGGTIDIFMSSDGQSIPFGTNWIHKIEQGLENARIMFVFITSNSIASSWIYFEAGFAYSKGIEVIPVGIGIDIGKISPPLNLLQGFNITSEESLNNIINTINKKFDYKFPESFTGEEYNFFNSNDKEIKIQSFFMEVVEDIRSSIFSYEDEDKGSIKVDMPNILYELKDYLINNEYEVSVDKSNNELLTYGLQLTCEKSAYPSEASIHISPYNFNECYKLLNKIVKIAYSDKKEHYISIKLNDIYNLVTLNTKISSLVAKDNLFSLDKEIVGYYSFKDIDFSICKQDDLFSGYEIRVIFKVEKTDINFIYELIERLYSLGIIYKMKDV